MPSDNERRLVRQMRRMQQSLGRIIAEQPVSPGPDGHSVEYAFDSAPRTVSLAQWRAPVLGETQPITVIGSAPDGNDFGTYGFRAILNYKSGGVKRRDYWVWPSGGFRRCIMAEEATLYCQRFDIGDVPGAKVAGAIAPGAYSRDECSNIIYYDTTDLGAAQNYWRFPHAAREFRVWHPDGNFGSWALGYDQTQSNPFSAMYTGISPADLTDWTPVARFNSVRWDGSDSNHQYAIVHVRA